MDVSTATIRLKASFPNKDRRLWPGQTVNVLLTLSIQPKAVVAPSQAIQTSQSGTYAFVVRPDGTAEMRPVVLVPQYEWGSDHRKRARTWRDHSHRRPTPPHSRHQSQRQESSLQSKRGQQEMNLSALFVRRPVMTTLVMLSVIIFGLMGYRRLPVSDLPNVDFPTILVDARLPGASPENMASSVATPLERQFSTIAGITAMTSSSSLGVAQITLQFDLDRDLDAAAQDVQAAIARTASRLPRDMPYPPSYRKVNPADMPILYLTLTSSTLPLYSLNEYGETLLAQQISTVSGVAQVQVFGSQKYAVRIQLDPKALKSRGLGIDEVSRAIQTANTNLPTGILYGRYRAFTVETTGQLKEARDFNPVIVSFRDGHPVRLQDVGMAIDSVEFDKVAAWYIDERAIVLAVQRQPGTNTVEVADAVKKLLPKFRSQLPAAVSLHILFDRSESIRESVRDVKFTLLFALCLVVLVIFLFLRRVSATLIPSVAMPLSIIGTFGVMYLFGYQPGQPFAHGTDSGCRVCGG